MGVFITIMDDGKKLRLRVLPEQTDATLMKYDGTKNVQGDRSIRTMYETGTILYAGSVIDTGRGFYRASNVRAATRDEARKYENIRYSLKGFKSQTLNIFDVI